MNATLEKASPCKVNLLLNILGKRVDGFHELETIMQPIGIFDRLRFSRTGADIQLSCDEPSLPTDKRNLVYRAAENFLATAKIKDGVKIELEKNIPMAAGLGGGSGNAAITLLGLNELFDFPLNGEQLQTLAASLGSDVPFFLQTKPALATGRGELIQPLETFPALKGTAFVLIHPGFGIPTAWAYKELAKFSEAINGRVGRSKDLITALETNDSSRAGREFYNSLEAPALKKYPLLEVFQDFLRANGAAGALMSGSGSTTFAVATSLKQGEELAEKFKGKFGDSSWVAVVAA